METTPEKISMLPSEGDVLLDIYYYEKDLAAAVYEEDKQQALNNIKRAEEILVELRSTKNS